MQYGRIIRIPALIKHIEAPSAQPKNAVSSIKVNRVMAWFTNVQEAVIHICMDHIIDVKCEREVFAGRKDGKLKEVRFNILPHESVFLELIPEGKAEDLCL